MLHKDQLIWQATQNDSIKAGANEHQQCRRNRQKSTTLIAWK